MSKKKEEAPLGYDVAWDLGFCNKAYQTDRVAVGCWRRTPPSAAEFIVVDITPYGARTDQTHTLLCALRSGCTNPVLVTVRLRRLRDDVVSASIEGVYTYTYQRRVMQKGIFYGG